jgi:hypothetical protein
LLNLQDFCSDLFCVGDWVDWWILFLTVRRVSPQAARLFYADFSVVCLGGYEAILSVDNLRYT